MDKKDIRKYIREHPDIPSRLSDAARSDIIRMRYIEGHKYEYIARALHYSVENIYVIHRKAIKEILSIIESEV